MLKIQVQSPHSSAQNTSAVFPVTQGKTLSQLEDYIELSTEITFPKSMVPNYAEP